LSVLKTELILKKLESKKPVATGVRNRRMGVGASAPKKPEASPAAKAASSRLMQVGRKKRGRGDEDNDDEIAEHNDGDDDEEELGRTGIVSVSTKQQTAADVGIVKSKKSKKKKGKKERQLEIKESEKTVPQTKSKGEEVDRENSMDGEAVLDAPKDTDASKDDPTTNDAALDDQKGKRSRPQKRSRPKKRSRQKNIYKDNRQADQKPDHLKPGGYEYKGRPMTPATKAKLQAKQGVSVPSGTATNGSFREVWDPQGPDSGVPVLSTEGGTPAMKTTAELHGDKLEATSNKRGISEKKKVNKKKYKNM